MRPWVKILNIIAWSFCIGGSCAGALVFLQSMLTPNSSPQQTAGASISIAFVVLPYVLARAIQEISTIDAVSSFQPHQIQTTSNLHNATNVAGETIAQPEKAMVQIEANGRNLLNKINESTSTLGPLTGMLIGIVLFTVLLLLLILIGSV